MTNPSNMAREEEVDPIVAQMEREFNRIPEINRDRYGPGIDGFVKYVCHEAFYARKERDELIDADQPKGDD